MNGVTIVEEHLCRVVERQQLIILGIFVTLLCIGALVLYRFIYKNRCQSKSDKTLTCVCSIAVVVLLAFFWVVQIYNYNNTHFEYTVEVDDAVTFNDFFDRYEIISVDGDRYRVKERC